MPDLHDAYKDVMAQAVEHGSVQELEDRAGFGDTDRDSVLIVRELDAMVRRIGSEVSAEQDRLSLAALTLRLGRLMGRQENLGPEGTTNPLPTSGPENSSIALGIVLVALGIVVTLIFVGAVAWGLVEAL